MNHFNSEKNNWVEKFTCILCCTMMHESTQDTAKNLTQNSKLLSSDKQDKYLTFKRSSLYFKNN